MRCIIWHNCDQDSRTNNLFGLSCNTHKVLRLLSPEKARDEIFSILLFSRYL